MKNFANQVSSQLSWQKTKLLATGSLLLLLLLPALSNAQTFSQPRAAQLQTRLQNSFNKKTVKSGNAVTANSPATFTVTPADAGTNPLANIIQSLVGSGVTVSNIHTNLPATSDIYGSFSGGATAVGINSGLIMTSGSVLNAIGPNISPSTSQDNGLPGYPALDSAGFDASVISFDVKSTTAYLTFNYVFASEEYNEYVGSVFNDEFAFFISGPGIPVGTNIALIPGTNTPVAINNVNMGLNPQFYLNNDSLANADPARFQALEYDGLTKVLTTSTISVVPGATYTITLVIQDVSDGVYDSGVFIEGGSITSDSCVLKLYTEQKNVSCYGASDGKIEMSIGGVNGTANILWSNGATTAKIENLAPGTYNVSVTDSKGCHATLSPAIVITQPAPLKLQKPVITNGSCSGGKGSATLAASGGTAPYSFTVGTTTNTTGIFTDLMPGAYSYSVTDAHACVANGSFVIKQASGFSCSVTVTPTRTVAGQATKTIYLGYGQQYVTLTGNASGTGTYSYDWGIAGSGRTIQVNPTVTTTYNLTVTDLLTGCSSYCSVTINVIDVRCGSLLDKVLICSFDSTAGQKTTKCVKYNTVAKSLKAGAQLGSCTAAASAISSLVTTNAVSFGLKASPNPTADQFTLQVATNNVKDKISVRIMDFSGRQVEVRNNVSAGQVIQIGAGYKPGTYIAELIQGTERVAVKLVKYNH